MADITEIKRQLTSRVDSVVQHLLPNAKQAGPEWQVGSLDGEQGQSLKIHRAGEKAGVWSDFALGHGGDVIDLWREVRKHADIGKTIDEARDWLGLERPKPYREPERSYVRPQKPDVTMPKGMVENYLRTKRGLSETALRTYRIGEARGRIVFPFLFPDGTLALAKVRDPVDGARPVPTAKDCEPILFGWPAIPPDARDIVIAEGEIDAMSWFDFGWPALSVPFGGGKGAKQQWIERDFERMDRFERIYLALDMDEEGNAAAEEIAGRLGRHRCLRVHMPRKDANQCLTEGVPKAEMDQAIERAQHLDPEGLRRASEFTAEVIQLFHPEDDRPQGYHMPYGKLRDRIHFRPGEVTLWSGASGEGKSQILSDCAVDWVITQGSRLCLSSLEMRAVQTLKRMCRQTVGVETPSEKAIHEAMAMLDRGLLLYEHVGKAGVDSLLEIFNFARAKYGCDQFIIDSFMRLGIASDDYEAQEQAMFKIVDWTIANNVHTHLVAHSRKGSVGTKRSAPPETEDIKGAMEIGANAFNIITVWRNRKLEQDIKAETDEAKKRELMDRPGVIVNIAKQRNGDYEGKAGLWFSQVHYRYRDRPDPGMTGSREYLPFFGTEAA